MSRSLLTLNVLSISIAAVLWVGLIQVFWSRPQLPTPRAPSAAPSRVARDAEFATDRASLTSYLVVATKSLFSPTRSETESLLGQQAAGRPKPVLHGVVIGGANRRAYLEDPVSRREEELQAEIVSTSEVLSLVANSPEVWNRRKIADDRSRHGR